jgi:ABC-type transport system involved in multi-copper enzyme maturation permease subunit
MIASTQAQPDAQRVAPIVMRRKDYLSVLLRLIGMDLYKVRRRLLSKMLLLIGTLVVAFVFLAIGIAAWHLASQPITSFVPANCAVLPHNVGCINHPATLADMQHEKQRILNGAANLLNMPGVWNMEELFVIQVFAVLGIILAGALVGGEYSLGTVRLMFTRGPGRMQFLIAKIVVLAIYIIPTLLFLMLLGTVIGTLMAQLAGIGTGLSFLTADRFGHLVLFLLLGMLSWFAYVLMALFFGTVGRSTVAGIVGPLVWLALEPLFGNIIAVLAGNAGGGPADFLKAIPDYFLGNNLASLLHNQGNALSFTDAGAYSNGHSLSVIAVYLLVFVSVAGFLTVRRDVTH